MPKTPAERGEEGIERELTGGVAPARAYMVELMPDILEGRIDPGRTFDRTVSLDQVPAAYRAMAGRRALKVLARP